MVAWKEKETVLITEKEEMVMRSKTNTDSDLSERACRADMGKLVLEGMMTVFIVLIFLFIAQNWVLTNVDDTPFTPTCRLSDSRAGIGSSVHYESNKIMDGYELVLQ